jgi:hypothetical protein
VNVVGYIFLPIVLFLIGKWCKTKISVEDIVGILAAARDIVNRADLMAALGPINDKV